MACIDFNWPKIKTAIAIKKEDIGPLCEVFNTGKWKKLNKSGFSDVKNYSPENIIFQHMSVKEQVFNAIKKDGRRELFSQWLYKTTFDIG